MKFLMGLSTGNSKVKAPLQIMYDIHGNSDLTEEIVENLSGYKGSGPARTGNGAFDQLKLDIYGELMDAVYLFNKHGTPISSETWTSLRKLKLGL